MSSRFLRPLTNRRGLLAVGAAAATIPAALGLVSCSNDQPFGQGGSSGDTIVIGTANFPESEIIGNIWADELRKKGFTVELRSGIGSREVYLAALAEGSVDIVPEYAGNLAQYYLKGSGAQLSTGATEQDVLAALKDNLPDGLSTGEAAPGQSRDSYRVSSAYAQEHGLSSLEDLKKVTDAGQRIKLAGNPELSQRPYGPPGLEQVYGIPAGAIDIVAISDGGGPLTIANLESGAADMADIYTTSPTLDQNGNPVDVVELKDPKGMILPQNVIPLLRSQKVSTDAVEALNGINSKLTTEALKEMNTRNVGKDKVSADKLAKQFVESN